MGWKRQLNVRLARATGVHLTRRGDGRTELTRCRERLLREPAFIFASVRSGSTLLRMMLNSHSQIFAPHELHLRKLQVVLEDNYVEDSMTQLGFDARELTNMLWDRVLDAALQKSGKSVLVEKTPNHVLMWDRVAQCWSDARFIFLLRHPAAIVDSWKRARPQQTLEETFGGVRKYAANLDEARRTLPGHTVRYEELVAEPERETRRLCGLLRVEWEPGMLEYGKHTHGNIKAGLGDWTQRIRAGRVQPPREIPAIALPEDLRAIAQRWGYEK